MLLLGFLTVGIVSTMGVRGVRLPLEAIAPTPSAAIAQIPAPDLSTSPTDAPSPPSGVQRIGDTEVTAVRLKGETLFEIASPTVLDRDNPDGLTPVELRAQKIEERLHYIVSLQNVSKWAETFSYDTVYDPETLQIQVRTLNQQTVITASDATRTEPQVLLTVTEADAEYHGLPRPELAEQWRDSLQTALTEQLRSRQPGALWAWAQLAFILLASLVGFSAASWILRQQLSTRKHQLQDRQTDEAPDRPNMDEPNTALDFRQQLEILEAIRSYFDLDQRVRWLDFFEWLLVWLQIIGWIIGVSFIAGRFPLWRFTVGEVLFSPVLIFIAWGAAGLVKRLLDLGINRAATFWRTQNVEGDVKRRSLRITTIANVLKGLATFLTYFISILFILEIVGFSTSSVLAFGAIIGFAVSLASQNLIRDLVNGFLILLEDQYAIGDVIAVDGVDGFVENLNLRTTQLRNGEGRLIVLPNSRINRVENLTRSWARVDHTVEVAANTNPH
ncbi:MAG: mechanosensitive ion channel family protein, partial [Cyanobacteria bacterium J06638_22]